MASSNIKTHFQRALLLALVTAPGCTGSIDRFDPPAACDFTQQNAAVCDWSFSFDAQNPAGCVGFSAKPTQAECLAACGESNAGEVPTSCSISQGSGTSWTLNCSVANGSGCSVIPPGNGGRRPAYFASLGFAEAPPGREVGTHFARVVCMEAGSVEAFRTLRAELRALRAPRRLLRAASRAARDEARHVRQTSQLARRFREAPVQAPVAPVRQLRSLEAVARENAVEGCVRETFSALECAWQAEKALDPVVRGAMKRIARDEARHLELSWAVHHWAMSRLDPATRAEIRAAQRREIATLAHEVAADPTEALVGAAGLPRATGARALIAAIEAACA